MLVDPVCDPRLVRQCVDGVGDVSRNGEGIAAPSLVELVEEEDVDVLDGPQERSGNDADRHSLMVSRDGLEAPHDSELCFVQPIGEPVFGHEDVDD